MEDAKSAADDLSWTFEADEDIDGFFPWREMSPEGYASRHSHGTGCYSYHRMRYRNPDIGKLAVRLGKILTNVEEMERVRRQFLTPEEYARVQQQIGDIREHGL